MAYSKYYPEGWKDNEEGGTPINAAALNNMETGIAAAHEFMARKDNPHGVTKAQVGLGNAENTADSSKNVNSAKTLTTPRTLDGISFNGGANITHYGTCSTDAATTAKTVACAGFTLAAGARITVKFTVTNTGAVGSLTLNVNGTGAKSIKYRGGNLPAAGTLAAGRVYTFMYDGTNYELVGDLDSNTTYAEATNTTLGLVRLTVSNPKAPGTAAYGSSTYAARADHVHPAQTEISGNAGTASKLAAARLIDGASFNGSTAIVHHGTCSTGAGTTEKVVTIASFTGTTLAEGARVSVRFQYANTAANPTLNVSGTGAKPIKHRNYGSIGENADSDSWAVGSVLEFIYANSNWIIVGGTLATASIAGLMSAADKSKLDGMTASADAVSFTRTQTSGTKIGTLNINGSDTILYAPTPPSPTTTTPLMDGSAAYGSSAYYARADHRHPTDTSRASAADVSNIMTLLQSVDLYKTASGAPATFSDAVAANVKELIVTIQPAQSGSGNPYPPGGGKNLIPMTLSGIKAANASRTWNGNSCTFGGVTFTIDTDIGGNVVGITMNGTPNGSTLIFELGTIDFKANTTYLLNGAVTNAASARIAIYQKNSDVGAGTSYTPTSDDNKRRIIIIISGTAAISGLTFHPMIRLASETNATFAPYSNIRPPIGYDSVTVTRTGTNGANAVHVTVSTGQAGTVYGGTLNVTAGEVTVTHGHIAGYNGETVPNGWISSTGALSGGAEIVYPLATPVTYPLTPAQLSTLAGYNAVAANAGSVSVSYKMNASTILGGG